MITFEYREMTSDEFTREKSAFDESGLESSRKNKINSIIIIPQGTLGMGL